MTEMSAKHPELYQKPASISIFEPNHLMRSVEGKYPSFLPHAPLTPGFGSLRRNGEVKDFDEGLPYDETKKADSFKNKFVLRPRRGTLLELWANIHTVLFNKKLAPHESVTNCVKAIKKASELQLPMLSPLRESSPV
ncbi:hypothetical protein GUITHDRAFT_122840, partial [Guillardia theta CCMP2712]